MTFDNFIKIIPKIKETEIDSNASHLKMAPSFRRHLLELTKANYFNSKKAGVNVVFHPNNNKVYFTLILRNEYKGVHSNQIGLPGGRFENEDEDIFQTALRETNEEIGIDPKKINLIKKLNNVYVPPSNYDIFPFMVYTTEKVEFIIDKNEVQEIINIEIDQLINCNIVKTKGSQISNRYINELVPAYKFNEHYVWGATAMILSEVKDIFISVL
tara:strand:- start:1050 stop:1691 length:642 start_codon:yes stop_codon:yes gene_type:complete